MTSTTDFGDYVEGTLISSLNTTATTGVTVKAREINGANVTWPTGAHRIMIVQKTRTTVKVEKINVASASQSGSTVTLGTLTRALSLTDGSDFSGGDETAQSFAAGATVYMTWDTHDAEGTLKLDIQNTMTGAGQVTSSSTTTAGIRHNSMTTTQRDAIPSPANGDMIYNTTTGQMNQFVAGAWIVVGDTGTPDGSTTVAGKFEEATTTEQGSGTAIGGTGARLIPAVANIVKTSSGSGDENKLAVMGSSGTYAAGFLGTGTPTAATTLTGDGAWTITTAGTPLFGDGSDGAKTVSSSEDLDPTGEFEYTTLTINVSQTVGLDSVNSVLVIKATGDVAINGILDLDGDGGAGGAGGAEIASASGAGDGNNGASGTAGKIILGDSVIDGGAGATRGGNGTAGVGGAAGNSFTSQDAISLFSVISSMNRPVGCGGGGGGGSTGAASGGGDLLSAAGAGGAGGGAGVIYVGGDLTLGASSTITCDGVAGGAGVNGSGFDGGGGAGGSGGMMFIIVAGSITDSGVTLSVSGGAAGGNGGGGGGTGSAGVAGKIVIYSLQDGTLITS